MSAELLRTVCTRDCPDACGIVAEVEDGRVLSLRGDKSHPVTQGFLCERTNRFLVRQYSPERLRLPLLREHGELRPASWEEAMSFVAARLRAILAESGPLAVFHYRSGGSLAVLKNVNDYFFELLGGATVKRGDICSGAGEAAQEADMGVSESHDLDDLASSRCIVLWGKNVPTSFVHMLPVLRRARARGARVVLVDPVPHRGATHADLVIRPRPGHDRFLALGLARKLLDAGNVAAGLDDVSTGWATLRTLILSRSAEAWAAAADVDLVHLDRLAAWYGEGPSNIQIGWGLQRRLHGGVTVRVLDALACLSGNLGVPGGGVTFYYRRRAAFDLAFAAAPADRRGVVEPLFGAQVPALRDPEIRAIFIDNGNPVAMLPDAHRVADAIASRELSVVLDAFLTDTAERATVVLPVTTMLEELSPVGAYGHHWLGLARPVAARPTDAAGQGPRTDIEIYADLAARLGFGDRFPASHEVWARRVMGPLLEHPTDPLGPDDLARGPRRRPGAPRVLFEGGRFPTADGRFHFVTEVDLALAPVVDPEYPLELGSYSTPRRQSSQLTRAEEEDVIEARVHPDAACGIPDGGLGVLQSRTGSLRVRIRMDRAMRPDMVVVPKGGSLRGGLCANALVEARTTDIGLGAAYYDQRVRIKHV